jgi:hypothetical protein
MEAMPVRFVTNSEIQTFKDCRRRWYLSYVRSLTPIRQRADGPLPLGNRVHGGLEGMYAEGADPVAIYDRLTAAAEAKLDPDLDDVKKFQKEAKLGHVMLKGYLDWLSETASDHGLEVVGVEQSLSAPLQRQDSQGREVHLLGKLDLRVRRRLDGAVLFLDHKTAISFARVFETLAIQEQFKQYMLLERLHLRATGEDRPPATGALVNVLRKVGRTAAAKPPFYAREEVTHNDHELRDFWYRVHAEVADMVACEARLDAGEDHRYVCYPRPSTDCTWRCPFFKVCGMFDDGLSDVEAALADMYEVHDPLLRYRDENRHPDMKEPHDVEAS